MKRERSFRREGIRACAVGALLLAYLGCQNKPTDPAAEVGQDCAKLESLTGGTWSALQKDRCLGELGGAGPNMHGCFHACLVKAKTDDDWEECKNDCTGFLDTSNRACSLITSDFQAVDACYRKHTAILASQPDVYTCWSKCGARAKTAAEAAACDPACSVPGP